MRSQYIPIANGIMIKPTNMSLTAKLTIRIFDAVCNFRTRQTVSITTRLPIIVKIHINGQIIIVIIKCAGLRVVGSFVLLITSSCNTVVVVYDDNNGIVDCSCREELNIVVLFISIIEDEICC
jgi:hypothetical protein